MTKPGAANASAKLPLTRPDKMRTNKMTTRTAEREEFLADIIIGAVEGGTGYWAQVSHYQYMMDGELHVYTGFKLEGGGTRATLHEITEDETDYKAEGMVVTTDTIAEAIGMIERSQIVGQRLRERVLEASRENDAANL